MSFAKRSRKSRLFIGLLIVALSFAILLPLSGCAKEEPPAGDNGDGTASGLAGKSVRIAFSAAPDAIDVVGYKMVEILKSKGLTVDVMYADGGAKAAQALLAGQADISANSLEDISAIGLKAFALSRPKNLYAIVAKPEITSLQDLQGKVIGAADPGSIANYIADAILEKNGMSHDDVDWLQIGGTGARAQALVAGRVDAVCVYGGKHVMLTNLGYNTLDTMQDEFPGLHDDMWASTQEWLDANSDIAVAICEAQIEAAKWFHDSPDEWLAMALADVEGLEEQDARDTYKLLDDMNMYPEDGLMTEASLDATVKFMQLAQCVPAEETWQDLATMEYMDQARENLGITIN